MKFSQEMTDAIVGKFVDSVIWGGQPALYFAKENNVSSSFCSGIRTAISLVKGGDVDKILDEIGNESNVSLNLLESVYKVMGCSVPREIRDAIDERRRDDLERRRKAAIKGGEATKKKYERCRENDIETTKTDKQTTPLWEQQNLLNEAKIIEQIGDLNDAVIPKYARDIIDALNKLDTHLIQLINKLS